MAKPFQRQVTVNGKTIYTLRMGREVPRHAVNLAYIYSEPLKPELNIQLIDTSSEVADNVARVEDQELILWADANGYLIKESDGSSQISSEDFTLTKEFGDATNISSALFYRYVLSGYHLDRSGLTKPGASSPAIAVADESGALPGSYKYRFLLENEVAFSRIGPNGSSVPTGKSAYKVTLYANFTSDSAHTYTAKYTRVSYQDGKITSQESGYTENINAVAVMLPKAVNDSITTSPYYNSDNTYTLESTGDGYSIKVPSKYWSTVDPRVKQGFWWKIKKGDVETQWVYDYVIAETQEEPKSLSTKNVTDLFAQYGLTAPAEGDITLYGAQIDSDGHVTSIASGVAPAIGNVKLAIATDRLYAYTDVPDTTAFDPSGKQSQGIRSGIYMYAKRFRRSEPFQWTAVATGKSFAPPTGGLDNTWIARGYNKDGNPANYFNGQNQLINADKTDSSTWRVFGGTTDNRSVFVDEKVGFVGTITWTTYVWVPSTITVTQSIWHDDGAKVFVNNTVAYERSDKKREWTSFSATLNSGWNKIMLESSNTFYVFSNEWRLAFSDTWSNRIQAALGSADFYMNSTSCSNTSWSGSISGEGTVSFDVSGQKVNFVKTVNINEVTVASGVTDVKWLKVVCNNSNVTILSQSINGSSLSFTCAINEEKWDNVSGDSLKHNVLVSVSNSSESVPLTVGYLNDIYSECSPPNYDELSTEYQDLVLFVVSDDKRVQVRLKTQDGKYLTDNSFPLSTLDESSGIAAVYRKSIADITTIKVVVWTNEESYSSSTPFALKLNSTRKIYLAPPIANDPDRDNWYMRVHNATVFRKLVIPSPGESGSYADRVYRNLMAIYPRLAQYEGQEVVFEYGLPEFDRQKFQTKPIVAVTDEQAEIIDEYTIRVLHAPISMFYPVSVKINGAVCSFRDIQASRGTIKMTAPISVSAKVYVSYSYHEEWIHYRGYYDGKTFWHLDVNPSPLHDYITFSTGIPGHTSTLTEYVTAQPFANPTNMLLAKPIYLYLFPHTIRYADNIIEQATSTIYHTTDPSVVQENLLTFVVGKIYIQPNSSLRDMTIIDTRTRGGGLDERITKDMIKHYNPEASHYWDIGYWDGQPYQENGVSYIRLPKTLLKIHGGRFTEEEIYEIVHKHLALGVLPYIEFVDEISDHVVTDALQANVDMPSPQ